MKTCSKCYKEIPVNPNRKRNICLPCHSNYTKEHYRNNKDYYVDKSARRKIEIRALVRKKKEVPCADCKKSYPYYVMDFDHLKDKKFDVSRFQSGSIKTVMEEIAKCEVVCANCHRERTQKRIKKPS